MKEVVLSEYGQPESFENIVRLASFTCGTRAALINFLDHDNQWTLFNVGWENKQIPKKDSICQRAIETDDILYIPNTDNDERLEKIEAVQKDPNIKFYAGASFRSIEGMTGTLCVIDDRPKKLTDKQKEALKTLSSEVEARLNLISQHQIIQKKNEELEKKARFLKNSLDVLLILDLHTLVIKEVHTEIEDKFGYTPAELEGKALTQFLSSPDFATHLRQWKNKKESEVFKFDARFLTKSGGTIWLMLSTSLTDGKLYVAGEDITKRKATDQLLIKEKELSDGIIQNLPGIFCLIDIDGKIKRMNKNMKSIVGYSREEIDNKSIFSFMPEDQVDLVKQKFKDIFKKDSARTECVIVSKSGNQIPFLFSGFRHEVEDAPFSVLLGINISEEKRALKEIEEKEKKLKEANRRLKNAQHLAKIGSWEWDIQNDVLYWSDETYKILQFDKKKHTPSIELLFERLPPHAQESMEESIERIMNGGELHDMEHDVILPDGKRIHVHERGESILDEQRNVIKITGSIQDLTERKNIELELKKALDEKEVMLMEIHHRVKNNLAVISGLLQLESGFGNDSTANTSLVKSISRVKSMAAIHEHLYKSQSFSDIFFNTYIRELVEIIEELYQGNSKGIKVNIHSDHIKLNINQAIPCALILSELISNSYKHAFEDIKQGRIDIKMSLQGDDVDIIVKDNGVGIGKNEDPEKGSSLGFTLVGILSKQLNADYTITSEKGMKTRLQFKREDNVRGASGNAFV